MNLFLEDDDLDAIGFSVRTSAQDLILNLAREMGSKGFDLTDNSNDGNISKSNSVKKDDHVFKVAFLSAIKKHFSHASEIEKNDPTKPWWKIVESGLYCMGIIASTIIYTINSGTSLANEYKAVLDTVLTNATNLNHQPFLTGRSIWAASRFSPIMNDQSLEVFLKMTATLLEVVEQPILRVFALRSTYYFCDHLSINKKVCFDKLVL